MANLFEKPEELSEFLFRIVDNGGSTADRYTVVFSDGSYLGMSGSPTHPQGVSMWGEDIDPQVLEDWVEDGSAIDLALGDLPPHLIQHILDRNNEGVADFLDRVEQKLPDAVFTNRDDAEANEGLHDTFGKGLYLKDGAYMVKMEGGPDDRGPFTTAREALLNTLPDHYGFCGPEYHSGVEVLRMTPDPAVAEAIKALEARREREWEEEIDKRY
jgi:hypothetical protein